MDNDMSSATVERELDEKLTEEARELTDRLGDEIQTIIVGQKAAIRRILGTTT